MQTKEKMGKIVSLNCKGLAASLQYAAVGNLLASIITSEIFQIEVKMLSSVFREAAF